MRTPGSPSAPQLRWIAFLPEGFDTSWMDQGLCSKIGDFDDWFPDGSDWHSGSASEAIAVCHQCPIRTKCLDHALTLEINQNGTPMGASLRHGIYGGHTPGERARLAHGKPAVEEPEVCKRNHPRTPENTRIDKRGWRTCRICAANRESKRYGKKAAS